MWGRISLVIENFGTFDLTDGFTNQKTQDEEITEDNRMRTRRSRKKFCYSHIAFMLCNTYSVDFSPKPCIA